MKYYLFYSPKSIPTESLNHIFKEAYQREFVVEYPHLNEGYVYADEDFLEAIELLLPIINNDLDINLVFLVSHQRNGALIHEAFARVRKLSHGVYHLADIAFEAIAKQDKPFIDLMTHTFDEVPHDWMLTAHMLIRCGLNRSLAARKLYVHRNTFNYRLNKFIELTGLDIRDYFNAQFFYLYTQLSR